MPAHSSTARRWTTRLAAAAAAVTALVALPAAAEATPYAPAHTDGHAVAKYSALVTSGARVRFTIERKDWYGWETVAETRWFRGPRTDVSGSVRYDCSGTGSATYRTRQVRVDARGRTHTLLSEKHRFAC